MAEDLYREYCDWVDFSEFEGKSPEEKARLMDRNKERYGLVHTLKPGAPLEAVKAWRDDAKQTREAEKQGKILN